MYDVVRLVTLFLATEVTTMDTSRFEKLEEKGIPYDYNPEIEILSIENKELEKKPTLKPEIPQEQQESERFRQNPENHENPEGRRESERFRQNPENHENPEGRRESERFRQNPENHENPEEKRASDEQPVINQLRTTKEQVKFLNEKFHFHPKPKKEKDPPKYKEENKITQQEIDAIVEEYKKRILEEEEAAKANEMAQLNIEMQDQSIPAIEDKEWWRHENEKLWKDFDRSEPSDYANSEPVRGNSEPIRGNSEPIPGNSEPIRGNSEPIRGNSEPIRGNSE
ncbi:histone-lysine N-methyltransferase, H3 lysine-79 specific-like isoform X7 [Homalodisca vitripennis]|uniref:histone-lysine N-methyltransferase, H3 lysine-79 specific-like isoform X7 n=1 Tax=Homalodisca vitripennis TaxID=197043 RepID=UPI001EEBFB87|nr:histone-lysine N-methyltransferase, H3 lysine-79 specific-like isoform X7 [Homalodisca vitripennis]